MYVVDLVNGFRGFVERYHFDNGDPTAPTPTLLDYFESWLYGHTGLEDVGGNRETALTVLILAAAWYAAKPEDWNGDIAGIMLESEVGPGTEVLSGALDRELWDASVFNRKYGKDEVDGGRYVRKRFPGEAPVPRL